MMPTQPGLPAPPDPPQATFKVSEITEHLDEWRLLLADARAGKGGHTVKACQEHLNRWLDELLAVRGR
jgi:hypothetical protein